MGYDNVLSIRGGGREKREKELEENGRERHKSEPRGRFLFFDNYTFPLTCTQLARGGERETRVTRFRDEKISSFPKLLFVFPHFPPLSAPIHLPFPPFLSLIRVGKPSKCGCDFSNLQISNPPPPPSPPEIKRLGRLPQWKSAIPIVSIRQAPTWKWKLGGVRNRSLAAGGGGTSGEYPTSSDAASSDSAVSHFPHFPSATS